ncbi:protein of unknown function [Rhodovastum atsumiense]|nr:protein of unknown function [Rhodovastum atsumiense]
MASARRRSIVSWPSRGMPWAGVRPWGCVVSPDHCCLIWLATASDRHDGQGWYSINPRAPMSVMRGFGCEESFFALGDV